MEMGVAPLAGAWIEARKRMLKRLERLESHPSRVRGLKLPSRRFSALADRVAPLAGAWIEAIKKRNGLDTWMVAPLAGAWIEA